MMRAQIINTYNNAMETEERVETLLYEEGLLREERKLLKRDYSRLPTAEVGCTIVVLLQTWISNKNISTARTICDWALFYIIVEGGVAHL